MSTGREKLLRPSLPTLVRTFASKAILDHFRRLGTSTLCLSSTVPLLANSKTFTFELRLPYPGTLSSTAQVWACSAPSNSIEVKEP
jgi:hypothetical protein